MKDWVLETIEVQVHLVAQGKCLTQPAVIAGSHVRFHLSQPKAEQSIAEIVIQNDQKDTRINS